MKLIIIGANGQLGTDLGEVLSKSYEVLGLTHNEIDISDFEQTKEVLEVAKPDIVLNTAAFHNVPICENNPLIAFQVNAIGARNLALLSNDLKYKLVQYSTDYVFDGKKEKPYIEVDDTNPLNVYANSKLAGENFVKNYCESYYIIRISGIYGKTKCRAKGDNFITTMIKLAKEKPEVRVVNDEILTPTPTLDIAQNTSALLSIEAFGTYHMTCEGECSWYEFAKEIFTILKLKTPLYETSVFNMNNSVKRPLYSVLENKNLKINQLNLMPYWKDSLRKFLTNNIK